MALKVRLTAAPILVYPDFSIPFTLYTDASSNSIGFNLTQIQRQLNLRAMPLESHYHLVGATGDTLTTSGTVQVDIVLDRKIWPTPAIVVSSLAHPLILRLNFLKLTKSKIDFETNNVEIGSKIYPADIHCITSSNSTIMIPTTDIYQPCQLLLNKKACRMVTFKLITVVVLTVVASHTHCHFKPPFKKQEESFASAASNLTWKELLAYSTSTCFTVKSQTMKSKKTCRLYLLDWAIPTVLAERLHITNHLVLGVYNSLHPQNTTLIQTVTHTHARCRFVIRDKEHPNSPIKNPNKVS